MDILLPVPALPAPVAQVQVRGAEEMNGLETIRLIKSRWPQVRIVVLTMYTTHRAAALAAGADAFLLKGCPAQDLLEAISSHASHPNGQG
jgi:DNA-binding NarL/FixJ family response regulator